MKLTGKVTWMIIGGIAGAIALICTCIGLTIVAGLISLAYPQIESIIDSWTHDQIFVNAYTLFTTVGSCGFIIGVFMGRRHAQIIQKWWGFAVFLGIPILFVSWMFCAYVSRVEVPQKVDVVDCTNILVKVHFKFPSGRYHRFAFPASFELTNKFSCQLNISNGAFDVTNLVISSDHPEVQCDFLKAQTNYDMELAFNKLPPSSTSLWLYWFQTYRDKKNDAAALP